MPLQEILVYAPGFGNAAGSEALLYFDAVPDTRIVIDDFLFSPAEGKLGFVSKISKGTAAYLSGKINKLSPGATRVETPLAVLGIRGTRFLIEVE